VIVNIFFELTTKLFKVYYHNTTAVSLYFKYRYNYSPFDQIPEENKNDAFQCFDWRLEIMGICCHKNEGRQWCGFIRYH